MKQNHQKSWAMAYCGIVAALCVALMLLGAVIPIAMFIAPAVAGFLVATVCVECGMQLALTAYAAVSLLALLFVPDKEVALIFVFLLGYYPLAKPKFERIRPAVLRIVCKLLLCNGTVLAMYGLVVGCVAMSGLLSFCVKKATARFLPPRATLLVYGNPEARKEGEDILRRLPGAFYVLDSISAGVGSEELCRQIFRWDARAVMLCGVPSSERNDLLKYCIDRNIEAYVRPNIGDLLVKGARAMQLDNLPVLVCHRSSPAIWYLALKRLTDILLSLAALVVFSPFMLITAIAIKLYDGGPILYKQLRLTKDGKQFYIYKFRSMRVDAEKDGVARLAQEHDGRITPVGKIIRAIRIDETPQLFCILVGDMSIVGPRPERPEIAEDYELEMPEFALRLQAKAGLTGLAQVYGKYNTTPYNKLQMDLQYIASMGVVEDLKIMFATVKILFMPESTEGVADGQTTAKADEEEKKTAT